MTKTEARKLLTDHARKLDKGLDAATSQFQVRICYVGAHEELLELARKIIDEVDGQ